MSRTSFLRKEIFFLRKRLSFSDASGGNWSVFFGLPFETRRGFSCSCAIWLGGSGSALTGGADPFSGVASARSGAAVFISGSLMILAGFSFLALGFFFGLTFLAGSASSGLASVSFASTSSALSSSETFSGATGETCAVSTSTDTSTAASCCSASDTTSPSVLAGRAISCSFGGFLTIFLRLLMRVSLTRSSTTTSDFVPNISPLI